MGISALSIVPFLKEQGNNLIGVEIGCDKAKSTRYLANQSPNIRKLYAVDPWSAYDDGVSKVTQEEQNFRYNIAMDYTRKLQAQDRVELIRKTSCQALDFFEDNSLDFVFIDGDHSYEAAYFDIYSWYTKVKPGGIVSGHDYRVKDTAVRAAVAKFCTEKGYKIPEALTTSWCWLFYKDKS